MSAYELRTFSLFDANVLEEEEDERGRRKNFCWSRFVEERKNVELVHKREASFFRDKRNQDITEAIDMTSC